MSTSLCSGLTDRTDHIVSSTRVRVHAGMESYVVTCPIRQWPFEIQVLGQREKRRG